MRRHSDVRVCAFSTQAQYVYDKFKITYEYQLHYQSNKITLNSLMIGIRVRKRQ